MRLIELENLLNNQPAVSGSTFLIGALYVVSIVLCVGFFVLGGGLLLESIFHYKIFLDWVSDKLHVILNEEQRWKIATSFGLLSLFLGIVFVGVIFLCRMVLNRNRFIIEIDDWIYGNLSGIKKTAKRT